MIPSARVDHRLPGRVRLRIPERRGDSRYFRSLARGFQEVAGVSRVAVDYRTGGVLVEHPGLSLARLRERAEGAGWFALNSLEAVHPPALDVVQQRLDELSARIQRSTQGEVDGRALMFLGLMVLAGRQLLKGEVLAPTATLLWYAGELLRRNSGTRPPEGE